ncbi:hypothetical protein DPMN_055312 [Dreissena polymorpha]|uniref:Uncharacterized protein n=1 Tax=Dreissena polymorpha TaxID=45954 RepID=A0A9D4CRD8_DREPO|nr:hypothetical protein DPMN_055312 [Dreissena polymorpha]
MTSKDPALIYGPDHCDRAARLQGDCTEHVLPLRCSLLRSLQLFHRQTSFLLYLNGRSDMLITCAGGK